MGNARKLVSGDPVLLVMVVAVVLAMGCSFMLRAMVGGGPKAARAEESRMAAPKVGASGLHVRGNGE